VVRAYELARCPGSICSVFPRHADSTTSQIVDPATARCVIPTQVGAEERPDLPVSAKSWGWLGALGVRGGAAHLCRRRARTGKSWKIWLRCMTGRGKNSAIVMARQLTVLQRGDGGHPHRHLGPAGGACGSQRLPLRRGLQASHPRQHGPHPPARRPVPDGAARHPRRGPTVPRLGGRPQPHLDRSLPSTGPPDRLTRAGVVDHAGAVAVGRGLPHRVGQVLNQGRQRRRRPERSHRPRHRSAG
jgi:hypothetical protein